MSEQRNEDKLKVLENIFGKDLTCSVIGTVLSSHDNKFDDTVDTLISMTNSTPSSHVNSFKPPAEDQKEKENLQSLQNMFGDLTQSVIATVYTSNKGDVGETVDTLLNLTSKDLAIGSGDKKEAEAARLEASMRDLERFNKLQLQLQEEAKRVAEESQKAALLRAQEEERIRKYQEDFIRQAEALKRTQAEERERSLELTRRIEQERIRADELTRKEEEQKRAFMEQERRHALEEATRRHEIELRIQEEKRHLETAKMEAERRSLEEERLRLQEEKRILELRRIKEEEERLREETRRRQQEAEQESAKRAWEDRLRQVEEERRKEEEARREEQIQLQQKLKEEAHQREEEERLRLEKARETQEQERLRLEIERIKLETMRKKVEEDRKHAEEKIRLLEIEAKKRDEEEQERRAALEKEEARRAEEERQRHAEEEVKISRQQAIVDAERKRKQLEDQNLSASVIVISPQVLLQKETAEMEEAPQDCVITCSVEGDVITGHWTLPDATKATPTDWLALFPLTQPANTKYTRYVYTGGLARGEFTFKGVNPGRYDIRFFPNRSYDYITRTPAIRVGPAAAINVQLAGEQLKVQYTFAPSSLGITRDWIGIFDKSQRRNKKYIASAYGNASGEVTFKTPRQPGTYEARLFAAGCYYNDQVRVEFVVEDHDSVSVNPQVVLAGGQLSAIWTMLTVEASTSDWVGIFKTEETNNSRYLASAYTQGASVGSVMVNIPKDIPAGVYELRLFAKSVGKYTTFKTSPAFTVTN